MRKFISSLFMVLFLLGFSASTVFACACGCGVFDVGTSSMFPEGKGGGTVYIDEVAFE